MNPTTRRPSTSWLAEVGRKPSFGAKGTQQTVAGVHLPEKLDLKTPRSNSFSVGSSADDEEIMHRHRQQFGLSKLREVDDGQESTSSRASSVQSGIRPSGFDSPTEQLQYQLSKNLSRRNTSAVIGVQKFPFTNSLPSDNDHAIDDFEEANHEPKRGPVRRYSEHNSIMNPAQSPTRSFEKFKTPIWHSNADLTHLEGSQGRRHSFTHIADIDPRSRTASSSIPHPLRDSIINDDDNGSQADLPQSPGSASARVPSRSSDQPYDSPGYFSGHGVAARMLEQSNSPMSAQIGSSRSPHGVSHNGQVLVMVSFKCARSDVYYVPENTGLDIKKGDVVIVEGDRGHDLGTVTHINVAIQEAKKLKIEAMEEHHKWLMMFSRYFQQHAANFATFSGATNAQGRMLGAMAGHGQIAIPENVDVKPRMIKRIAGVYEIQKLQEKEGAEAKAKRLCQQKVIEHGLPMEILDAEYQLDHKKLTFYFFAERYIDFNNLVSELFKIYKTRIWMSAVNPASFPHPTNPRAAAMGPGAALVDSQYSEPSAGTSPVVGSGFGGGIGGFGRGATRSHEHFSRAALQSTSPGLGGQFPPQMPHMPVHPYNAPAMYPTAHITQTDTRPWYETFQGLSLEPRNGN